MKKIIFLLIIALIFGCDFLSYYNEDQFNEEKKKFNSNLSSVEIKNLFLYPEINKFNYNFPVGLSTSSVTIIARSVDKDADIKINGISATSGTPMGPLQLNSSSNTIRIEVTSSKGNHNSEYNINVIKTQEDTYNWDKKISSYNYSYPAYDDYAYSTAIDKNNNVYVAGSGYNLVSGSSASGYDWWIKKFSGIGAEDITNWNKKYSSANSSNTESSNAMAVDSNNNVYVAGIGYNLVSGSSGADWWIKKFNNNGVEDTIYWNKKFSGSGSMEDEVNSIAIDSNNNVYVAGYGYNLVSSSSYYDWWIKKFDSNGIEDTINWNKEFNFSNSDRANTIIIDLDNNIYVAGINGSGSLIKKFTNNGAEDAISWNKSIGSGSANAIAIDSENNVYVAGTNSSGWLIKKFNDNGIEDTINWNKTTTSGGSANSIAIDSNNNVYVAGYGYNLVSSSSAYDWLIKKYDNNGIEDTTSWNKKYSNGSSFTESANSMAIDKNNSVYVTGCGYNLIPYLSAYSQYDWWIKKFFGD